MVRNLRQLLRAEDGATAIEYGLIAALVSITLVAVLTLLGSELESLFLFLAGIIDQSVAGAGGTP
jgi:pilus assembly protein Flp/PilA